MDVDVIFLSVSVIFSIKVIKLDITVTNLSITKLSYDTLCVHLCQTYKRGLAIILCDQCEPQ